MYTIYIYIYIHTCIYIYIHMYIYIYIYAHDMSFPEMGLSRRDTLSIYLFFPFMGFLSVETSTSKTPWRRNSHGL